MWQDIIIGKFPFFIYEFNIGLFLGVHILMFSILSCGERERFLYYFIAIGEILLLLIFCYIYKIFCTLLMLKPSIMIEN